jgi:putative redox protein
MPGAEVVKAVCEDHNGTFRSRGDNMSVKVRWLEKSAFAGRSENGHWIMMDSTFNDGDGAAPSPIELVLIGLGGCSGIDLVAILQKMRQEVTGVEVTIDGRRAEENPAVYVEVKVKYRITGRNLSEKRVRAAVELADEEYCAIAAMLRNTAEYTYEVEIEDEAGQSAD